MTLEVQLMDILNKLYHSQISIDEAYAYYDSVMESDSADNIQDELRFSKEEWTAFCQGAPLDVLAKWRHEGWPSRCIETNEQLEIKNFHWLVVESEDGFTLKKI